MIDVDQIRTWVNQPSDGTVRFSPEQAKEWINDLCDEVVTLREENEKWQHLALHALFDLQITGVPIECILGMTPEVLSAVEKYGRDQTSFS